MSAKPENIHDRRVERPDLPPCPECESTDARVMSRTDYVVYVSCEKCHLVWSVPKPRVVQLGN
jgi:hypothetical protein